MSLHLYTTVPRLNASGEPLDCEVNVSFVATTHGRYHPATRTDPAEYPEVEIAFDGAELDDKREPPLTPAELHHVELWFETQQAKAVEVANDNQDRDPGPDPDDARDRQMDDKAFDGRNSSIDLDF